MTANREKLIDKIRKLMAKANGTDNQDEAALFMEKVQELLVRNDQADIGELTEDSVGVMEGERIKPRYDTPWFRGLANRVAKYYMCGFVRYRVTGARDHNTYCFVGRQSRIIVASQMFAYIEQTIYRLSNEASKDGIVRRNFQKGAAINMAWRLENMLAKSKADNPGNLPALYDEAMSEVNDHMKGIKRIKSRQIVLGGAGYSAGIAAANNISMNAQVNATRAPSAPLLTRR